MPLTACEGTRMNVVYLPLDSRPCNARFPVDLLRATGIHCVVPPPEVMDYFARPSDAKAVATFLRNAAALADTMIVSVDQLVYGSLLSSREGDCALETALERLRTLEEVRAMRPDLHIVAFSVIQRASISALKAEDLPYYEAFTAYAQAAHRAEIADNEAAREELRRVEARIPAWRRTQYHQVRARNHAVNRRCVELVASGVLDRLLLLQEDAQPHGFHRLEQAVLHKDIDRQHVKDRVMLHNGADEGGCLCAALVAGRPLRLHVRALGQRECEFIARYEDRPFIENIRSHCAFAGILLTDEASADCTLYVLTPFQEAQGEVVRPQDVPVRERLHLEKAAMQLAEALQQGKRIALLDVYYANGGSLPFMEALATHAHPLSLCGYAAWNTASNALGTILAQIMLGQDNRLNRLFTAERLLDDLLYQGNVRFLLRDALAALGEDALHLEDVPRAEQLLRRMMAEAQRQSPAFARMHVTAAYKLLWPRVFEVDVTVDQVKQQINECF